MKKSIEVTTVNSMDRPIQPTVHPIIKRYQQRPIRHSVVNMDHFVSLKQIKKKRLRRSSDSETSFTESYSETLKTESGVDNELSVFVGNTVQSYPEQYGFLNRHAVLVNNYRNIVKMNSSHCFKEYPLMFHVLPTPGNLWNYSHKYSMGFVFQRITNAYGWFLAILPFLCLVLIGYLKNYVINFTILYISASCFCLCVGILCVINMNIQKFRRCPFMIPVRVNSPLLKGMRNNFKDVTFEELNSLSVITKEEKLYFFKKMKNMKKGTKVRLMFYSTIFNKRYIELPRKRILIIVVVHGICLVLTLISFIRKKY